MNNIIKNTSKGFTLIELVMVTIILGILAAVAIPRYQETVDNAEAAAEKSFADMVWAGLEEEASEMLKNFYKDSKRVDNKKMKLFFNYNLKYPTYEEGLNNIFNNNI